MIVVDKFEVDKKMDLPDQSQASVIKKLFILFFRGVLARKENYLHIVLTNQGTYCFKA